MHDDLTPPHPFDPGSSAAGQNNAASLLDIRVATQTGPVLVLSGEADVTTLRQLEDALNAQIAAGARVLTADLSGLRFADSATIGALVRAHRALQDHGGRLDLLNPQPALAHVLILLGVDQVLTVRRGAGPGPGHPCTCPGQMTASHDRARQQQDGRACK